MDILKLLKRRVRREQVANELSRKVKVIKVDSDTLAVVHPSGIKGEVTFLSEEMDKKVLDRTKALVRVIKTLGEKVRKIKGVDESAEVIFGIKHEVRFNKGYIVSFPYLNVVRGKDYEVFVRRNGETEIYGDREKASRIVEIIRG